MDRALGRTDDLTERKGHRLSAKDEVLSIPALAVNTDMDRIFNDTFFKTNTRIDIKSMHFTFTTDVNAANRFTVITIADRLRGVVFATSNTTAITASLVSQITLSPNTHFKDWDGVSLACNLPMPNMLIKRNDVMAITVTNLQVGDQIGVVNIVYDRYEGAILDY